MNLFEELVAIKGAIEIDFVSPDIVTNCLADIYQQYQNNLPLRGILTTLLEKKYLTEAQIDFLKEGLEEDQQNNNLPPKINVYDYTAVVNFLGLQDIGSRERRALSPTNESSDRGTARVKMRLTACPHCNAKYYLKLGSKSNKFRCAKCRRYFYVSARKVDAPRNPSDTDSWAVAQNPPSEASSKLSTVNLSRGRFQELVQETLRKHRQQMQEKNKETADAPIIDSQTKKATVSEISLPKTIPKNKSKVYGHLKRQAKNKNKVYGHLKLLPKNNQKICGIPKAIAKNNHKIYGHPKHPLKNNRKVFGRPRAIINRPHCNRRQKKWNSSPCGILSIKKCPR